ncbi:MAG: tetratricopeptide repeat protein, partial [Gemmatimonadaceae bacterium]
MGMVRRRTFALGAIAALFVFIAAYANSLDNAFHFDDSHVVEQNIFIRDLANIPRIFSDGRAFSSLPQNSVYRPIVTLTMAMDYRVAGGLDPTAFHVTQLALFALVGIALIILYRKVFERAAPDPSRVWVALIAATLFCVHTANTQVGNYISARSESLAALGVLGGFLMYIHGGVHARRWHLYLLPVVVGTLAKNHAIVFAPLLLVYKLLIEEQLTGADLFSREHRQRVMSALRSSLPAFAIVIAAFLFVERMAPPGQNYGGGNRGLYLATEAWVWVRYVGMYFLPVKLSADTDLSPFPAANAQTLAGILLLLGSLGIAWKMSRTATGRPIAFGILWFWIAIAPTSSIMPLAEVTNDHRPFLAFAGLNAAVLWAAWLGLRRLGAGYPLGHVNTIGLALAVLVIAVHAVSTYQRNKVWRTSESLWADVTRKSPGNGRALMNYGLVFMRRGDLDEARRMFLRARERLPNYSVLETNLGVVEAALGNPTTAEPHFTRAIALDASQPSPHYFYARFLVAQGRAPEAIPQLQQSISLSPASIDARHLLMALYAATDQQPELGALIGETLLVASS